MSGPILITVAKLPCKTRNRCAGDEIGAPLTRPDITNESDQFALPHDRADRPAANLIDQPRRHSVSGNDPMTERRLYFKPSGRMLRTVFNRTSKG